MKPPIHDPSARQHSGAPSPLLGRGGTPTSCADVAEVDRQIAKLLDRSTRELRLGWRQSYGTGPPQGLSRDLLIRALAHQLQEHSYGGMSRALRRRLQRLPGASAKDATAVDPGLVLKAGTTLVRQW